MRAARADVRSAYLQILAMVGRLIRQCLRARIAAHDFGKIVVQAFELKNNLIRLPGSLCRLFDQMAAGYRHRNLGEAARRRARSVPKNR